MPFARRAIAQKAAGPPPSGDDFVFDVTTTGADESFTIPCQDVGTFNATIDWGDGTQPVSVIAYNDANLSHTYAVAGVHEVTISGIFPNVYFNNLGDRTKITKITTLGDVGWLTMDRAFYGVDACVSIGPGDLSACTSFFNAFYSCSALVSHELLNIAGTPVFNNCWRSDSNLTTIPSGFFDTYGGNGLLNAFLSCALTQQSVDNVLVSLDFAGQSDGRVTITGGTNSSPGAAGLIAKANLEARGWIVDTN